MKYTKPDVAVLGEAVVVIEAQPKVTGNTDNISGGSTPKDHNPNGAYDLDE